MAKKLQIIGNFPSSGSDPNAIKTINGVKPDEAGNVDIGAISDEELEKLITLLK